MGTLVSIVPTLALFCARYMVHPWCCIPLPNPKVLQWAVYNFLPFVAVFCHFFWLSMVVRYNCTAVLFSFVALLFCASANSDFVPVSRSSSMATPRSIMVLFSFVARLHFLCFFLHACS